MATHPHQHRHSGGNGHDNRNPREIEHDIEQTRNEMDHTLDELSERLSPRHLLDMAYDYFRSSAPSVSRGDMTRSAKRVSKSVGNSLLHQIERHPIPALLIGAGIAYAFFVEEDEDDRPDFHSQWADIPEYSGSFVDARTGEPYDLETYGAEWKQEAAAWHPAYDWSRSDISEESWTERAKKNLSDLKTALADTTKPARDKMRHAAASVVGLSGHKRRAVHARWENLRSHGGEWVDLHSGERYDPSHARDWEAMMACDYAATEDWSAEDEATWTEKAQHALEEMQQTLSDTGRSAKEQVQAVASKIGGFVGSTRDMSADIGRSMYARAGQAGSSMRHGAAQAGRGVSRGARYLGRKTRQGGSAMQHQLQHGYAYSRDTVSEAIDEYPLAAGAAFLGLGLLLGLALPRTRYEDEMMGERSDELKHLAKETGREAVERAKHVGEATAAAALHEAENEGLTPAQLGEKVQQAASSVKQAVQETSGDTVRTLGDKVAHIAQAAVETAKEETKKEAKEMTS